MHRTLGLGDDWIHGRCPFALMIVDLPLFASPTPPTATTRWKEFPALQAQDRPQSHLEPQGEDLPSHSKVEVRPTCEPESDCDPEQTTSAEKADQQTVQNYNVHFNLSVPQQPAQ